MIDKFQFDPVEGLQNATAYPDDPGNEEAFREQLQRPLNQVKDFVNSLVDAYAKTEAGRSGAEEIGSEAISGLMDPSNPLQPALTVRKQLQAAQKNIDDIIAGIIPDGSVDTEKIADGAVTPDKVSGGVGCNYIRNRIPTTGDNFDLGYKVGDTWTVPDMTLNIGQEPEYAGMHWYCKGSGVWQSSSQLTHETKDLYGVENVEDALKRAIIDFSSYQMFCANVNVNSLDCAFGKNNEDQINGLGIQLAMYSWFKGDSRTTYPFINLKTKNTFEECCLDVRSYDEMSRNSNLLTLINSSPYAKSIYDNAHSNEPFVAGSIAYVISLNPDEYTTIDSVMGTQSLMDSIANSYSAMGHVSKSSLAKTKFISSPFLTNAISNSTIKTTITDKPLNKSVKDILESKNVLILSLKGGTDGAYTSNYYAIYEGTTSVLFSNVNPPKFGSKLEIVNQYSVTVPYSVQYIKCYE